MKASPARAAIGVAAEGAGVHSRPQALGDFRRRQHGAAGQAAAERLRERHHVGRHAEPLVGEPVAGPSAAGLHFVEHQQQLVLVGQLAQPGQEAVGRNADAAFALDRLDQDRRGFVVDQPRHGVEIAERGVDEAGHQRPEALVVFRLSGGGDRAHRAAVEAALERDDLVAAFGGVVQPGELDRRLVGLGAGIAEERLAAETPFRKGLGPKPLQLGVPRVRHVDQLGPTARGPPRPPAAGSVPADCSPIRRTDRDSGCLPRPRCTILRRGPGRRESGRNWESRSAGRVSGSLRN